MSRPRAAGISVGMGRAYPFVRGLWLSALLALAGCDMEALRSGALYPRQDAAVDRLAPDDGPAERAPEAAWEAGADTTDAEADLVPDAVADTASETVTAPDAAADVTGPTGMLSGSVIDTCRGSGVDALVGIAGRHACSFRDKGSYFFPRLPIGTLKLAASKEGYALYEATIEIVAGGNIHDIRLVPAADGGCSSLPSPPAACTCTAPTCEP